MTRAGNRRRETATASYPSLAQAHSELLFNNNSNILIPDFSVNCVLIHHVVNAVGQPHHQSHPRSADKSSAHMSSNKPPLQQPRDPSSSHHDSVFLHVHDLPQLYQKPSAPTLLHALEILSSEPPASLAKDKVSHPRVAEPGVPSYLTLIVSSSLSWIEDDGLRDKIWDLASLRLSERSGRSAMPAMNRIFWINQTLSINLHEPSLTEDNLGLKTWTSSLLLSRRLAEFRRYIPAIGTRVLELGAGTGLVGISAACIWNTDVLLTDLPEIIPNLQRNLERNEDLVEQKKGSVKARALDWADNTDIPTDEKDKFMIILAADPIYSADHPKMLVNTVCRWIRPQPEARFIVELPLRDRYDEERQALRENLRDRAFGLVVEGTDTGYDDWHGRDGAPAEVECWWSIWKLTS